MPQFYAKRGQNCIMLNTMRIDPKGTIQGVPVLRLRKLVRVLNNFSSWDLKSVQAELSVGLAEARDVVEALKAAGLAKMQRGKGSKTWTTTPLAQSFASASAAKPITRQTAERALADFLARVERVNSDDRFLAKVTRVIIFGSYLRTDMDRLGDVDMAIELQPKEKDRKLLRELNYRLAAQSEREGHRFTGILDRELWWKSETFRFLKSRSRSISMLDYKLEKEFVDRVPHQTLLCTAEEQTEPPRTVPDQVRRPRRPRGCPF
jgi:predicted nucleotidyltransferase